MGSALSEKYFDSKRQAFNHEFKHKINSIMKTINDQVEKESALIRAEYDKKLLEITKYNMNKFNVSIKINTS